VSADAFEQIVVIDYDCMSSLGTTFEETWRNLVENRSGIQCVDRYDPAEQNLLGVATMQFGGQIPIGLDELAGSPARRKKWPEPSVHALEKVCARLLGRQQFDISQHDPYRIAILGGTALTSAVTHDLLERTKRAHANSMLCFCQNIPLAAAAMSFGIQGPLFSVGSACASSNHALLIGAQLIQAGSIDAALITGFEFPFVPAVSGGFVWLNAIYRRDNPDDRAYDDPALASRPFSVDRRGFLLAEGVGAVLLSSQRYAQRHGWSVKGRLCGGSMTSDATGYTAILDTSIEHCMRQALEKARVSVDDLGCINAHATSTPLGDRTELETINRLFGDALRRIPVVSNKSQIGHSLGATSILELMLAVEGMNRGIVLPTLNYREDPELPKAFVPSEAIELVHEYTLVNSFGFGGTNSSLVVRSAPGTAAR
jgi:3-oxoacyl-[acyl-carrier-protein] synthase II